MPVFWVLAAIASQPNRAEGRRFCLYAHGCGTGAPAGLSQNLPAGSSGGHMKYSLPYLNQLNQPPRFVGSPPCCRISRSGCDG